MTYKNLLISIISCLFFSQTVLANTPPLIVYSEANISGTFIGRIWEGGYFLYFIVKIERIENYSEFITTNMTLKEEEVVNIEVQGFGTPRPPDLVEGDKIKLLNVELIGVGTPSRWVVLDNDIAKIECIFNSDCGELRECGMTWECVEGACSRLSTDCFPHFPIYLTIISAVIVVVFGLNNLIKKFS